MNRRRFIKAGAAATVATLLGDKLSGSTTALPEATAQKLPRWRGFNLLEKFLAPNSRPYAERDFEWMAEWGFDFVRLPMDYRCWAKAGGEFHEPTLREIDQAVGWGKQYGIHVSLNFHRGPGYCVNPPQETGSLWTDPSTQERFAHHWGVFAKRYADSSNREISFNLINEPANVDGEKYGAALMPAIEAIRAVSPGRLIIADGLDYGSTPAPGLLPLGIAQSMHCYEPLGVTHYRAPWVEGSDNFPTPRWPVPVGINKHLFGNQKPELQVPLILTVNGQQAKEFSIHIDHVSAEADLVIKADGSIVFRHLFQPGSGDGEWKKSLPNHWGGFDADYDRDFTASIPAGTKEIQIGLESGDWLTFSSLQFGDQVVRPTDAAWGVKQSAFVWDTAGVRPVIPDYSCSREILWDRRVRPWMDLAAKGVGVHVGEWGVYHRTPHDVTLAWMHDCLENWKAAGFGWSLWNFRGDFGVLDSGREDVKYENFRGHQLDRKMLDLLRSA